MSGKKPLIFVRPLSESLKKLHEVISETANEDGIEIFDVDELNEANQLIPSIGQSLTIFSNPKKCAAVLQTNKKPIQKLNSKVILLSSTSIPRKTLDKFSKIGLTECIVEPVPPKTLLYKVKLLLRSIASTNEEEEKNEERKFSHSDDDNNDSKNEKQRLEKGIISSEENIIDMTLKGKLGLDLDIKTDEDNETKKNNYKESDITTNWEGDVGATNLDFAPDDEEKKNKKNSYTEENIDNYLRNKKNNQTELSFQDEATKKAHSSNTQNEDEDLYEQKSKSNSLTIQSENEDRKSKNKNDNEKADDKFYKGKISEELNLDFEDDDALSSKDKNSQQDDFDEESNKTTDSFDLNLESLEEEAAVLAKQELEEIKLNKEKKTGLELDASDDEGNLKKNKEELILEKEKNKKKANQEENQNDTRESRKQNNEESLNLESEEDLYDQDNDKNPNDIEKYMKGNLAKTITLTEEEEIDARNANSVESDEDNKRARENLDFGLELAAEKERNAKNKEILNNLLEANKKENEDGTKSDKDSKDEDSQNNNSFELDVEREDATQEDEDQRTIEDDFYNTTSKSLDLKVDSDDDELNQNKENDENDEKYNRLKKSSDLNLEVEKEKNKYSGHTEHIQTNLDSRKSLNHQEYDWDINKKKENSENYEQGKKAKSEIEISFKQKVDLGEQTIDYRKLHDASEAITITRSGNKQKKTGPTYTSDDSQKEFLKGLYEDEYSDSAQELLNDPENKKKNKVKEEIFFPNSNGIEVAIKILNKYSDKKLNKDDLYDYVYSSLNKLFGASTFFYNYETHKNDFVQNFTLSPNSPLYNEIVIVEFAKIFERNIATWRDLNLPTWENEKFNTKENMFFYPLYEGANKLGFCVCLFDNSFDGKSAKSVEVILESLRGIFLDDFHKQGNAEKYNVNLNKDTSKSNSKDEKTGILGLIGKLFGRAS